MIFVETVKQYKKNMVKIIYLYFITTETTRKGIQIKIKSVKMRAIMIKSKKWESKKY